MRKVADLFQVYQILHVGVSTEYRRRVQSTFGDHIYHDAEPWPKHFAVPLRISLRAHKPFRGILNGEAQSFDSGFSFCKESYMEFRMVHKIGDESC